MTVSPSFVEPMDIQVCWLTVLLTNRTDPSANRVFTPPGWALLGTKMCPKSIPQPAEQSQRQPAIGYCCELGGMMIVVRLRPGEPVCHRSPRSLLVPYWPDWMSWTHCSRWP